MTDETVSRPRRRRRRFDVIRAVLACGLALGLGSVGTMARWSTGASIAPGPTRSGQLDVLVNGDLAGVSNIDGTSVQATWQIEDMLSNEYTTFLIEVKNGGTMPLDLRMGAYAEGDLAPGFAFGFFDGGVPTGNGQLTNVTYSTWRQAECQGGLAIGPIWRLIGIGAENETPIATTKRRLNVGESHSYCVRAAVNNQRAVWENTDLLGKTGTIVVVLHGTQVGAP